MALIDSHAHVWDRTCTFVAGARYHPGYEATIDTYLRLLDAHGIDRAVLVQPSFLGTDNRYLLGCLTAHPDRLRGIVVLDPSIGDAALDDMSGHGVIGLRYNLLSLSPTALDTPPYRALTRRANARGWWIEVQARGVDWPAILPLLEDTALMVDHFAKPSGPDCPGQSALLHRRAARTCLKLSAPYRQTLPDMRAPAQRLIGHFGAERCLWGSDWPWTQHEGHHGYQDTQDWLSQWATTAQRQAMTAAAPALLGF